MKRFILFAVFILIFSAFGFGQKTLTENTLRADKDFSPASSTIEDISWLEGIWSGTGFGGIVKEVWTKTGGGDMVGTFSLAKNGKPVFYEFMQMTVKNNRLILRLKHFNPDMTGWEEKDKTVDFKFIKKEKNRVCFSGLTFERVGKNKLNIYLAMKKKDKTYREEVFKFSRDKK